MKLKSDFTDWYDHMFDGKGYELNRMASNSTTHRRELFWNLEQCGYPTPKHGTYEDLYKQGYDGDFVLYKDPYAHRGEGKCLSGRYSCLLPEVYCSQRIPTDGARSIRHLWIGSFRVELEYSSDHAWMSNVGDVDIELVSYSWSQSRPKAIKYLPLVAIDFVRHIESDFLFAIDFNSAPGIPRNIIRDFSSSFVVDTLESYISKVLK